MAKLSSAFFLVLALVLSNAAALPLTEHTVASHTASKPLIPHNAPLKNTLRSYKPRKCSWKCLPKKDGCYSRCRWCCKGKVCSKTRCTRRCYAPGCKRRAPLRCTTTCLRSDKCYKKCRRCCRAKRCVTRFCVRKCYRKGCSPVTVTAMPKACNCKRLTSPNSKCYYYPIAGSRYCESRRCRPSFGCVAFKTGLRCLRRKVSKKIVSTDKYTCITKKVNSFTYVPYSSS